MSEKTKFSALYIPSPRFNHNFNVKGFINMINKINKDKMQEKIYKKIEIPRL